MKTMKKNAVLKMLTGATVAILTVTEAAVPMETGSVQNKADVFETADEDVRTAEMIVDTKIASSEINIAEEAGDVEEILTEPEYIVNDEQSMDVIVAAVQDSEKGKAAVASQVSENRQAAAVAGIGDSGQAAKVGEQVVKTEEAAAKEAAADNKEFENGSAVIATAESVASGVVKDKPSVTEEKPVLSGDKDSSCAAYGQKSGGNIATDTAECTVTGIVEGTGRQTGEDRQPAVPAEPEVAEEKPEDEDCVVGHRYCVCGTAFNIYKNSGLDKDAWMTHVREHAAKGEAVRYSDK